MIYSASHSSKTISNTHNLKEKRLIFAHSLRVFSPWLVGSKGKHHGREMWCLVHGDQKSEQGNRTREERVSYILAKVMAS